MHSWTGPLLRKSLPLFLPFTILLQSACTILATRPIQPMADASTAIRAAREVQAETKTLSSTELFRKALDWFEKAKVEFRLHNFSQAELFSNRARVYAESAEFEAIRDGGQRRQASSATSDVEVVQDPMANPGFSNVPAPPSETQPSSGENPFSPEGGAMPSPDPLAPPVAP